MAKGTKAERTLRYRIDFIDPFRFGFLLGLVCLLLYLLGALAAHGGCTPWQPDPDHLGYHLGVGSIAALVAGTLVGVFAAILFDVIAPRLGGLPIQLRECLEDTAHLARCPACGAEVLEGASFCPTCDDDLRPGTEGPPTPDDEER